MDRLTIERRGGLANLKGRGEVDAQSLGAADRAAVDALFRRERPLPPAPGADRYVYVVTRVTEAGRQKIEVPEHLLPAALAKAVRDELP
jgi:hypothetical protein